MSGMLFIDTPYMFKRKHMQSNNEQACEKIIHNNCMRKSRYFPVRRSNAVCSGCTDILLEGNQVMYFTSNKPILTSILQEYYKGYNSFDVVFNSLVGKNDLLFGRSIMLRVIRPARRSGNSDKLQALSLFGGRLNFYNSIQKMFVIFNTYI